MKKIFATVALALSAILMVVGTTSCDKINDILDYLIGGQTYNYKGSYTIQLYTAQDDETELEAATKPLTFENSTLQVITTGTGENILSAKLVLPETPIMEGVTMKSVTLTGLSTANGNLTLTANSTAIGSLTYNGEEYPVSTANLEATVSNETLFIKHLEIYFGQDQNHAVLIEFPDGLCYETRATVE